MRALWLASWYPNRLSPYNGDFIKRHAAAVSKQEDIQVIYVVRDEKGELTKEVLIENMSDGALNETIIYYYSSPKMFRFFDKLSSEKKYRRLFKQAVESYITKKGKPQLVHVHVGMKAGVIALWLKRTKRIPYVLTEHWSGFLAEAKEKLKDIPFYFRSIWSKIINEAAGCSAVSHHLASAIKTIFLGIDPVVIPNVVDTRIFFPAPRTTTGHHFIHISGLDELKNPGEILKAFGIVCQTHPSAQLEIFGSVKQDIVALASEYGLQNNVSFHPEVPQSLLAVQINNADALILYSSYETFGCVVIEANACGVPVIVSDIPVFHETVKEGENGYFVTPHSPEALAERMMDILNKKSSFDRDHISAMTGSKYSYEVIGRQFSNWYRDVLSEP
jgi:glycosyltransferase involved in cell wall biosynthesis